MHPLTLILLFLFNLMWLTKSLKISSCFQSKRSMNRSYYRLHSVSPSSASPILVQCLNGEEMEYLGEQIADYCGKGDVLLLTGDLGAGKTTLSRGLVRRKLGDNYVRVTSPTYLLDNMYQYGDSEIIHHFDLYRLPTGCDVKVLEIPQVYSSSLCIVEWPQRLNPKDKPLEYLGIDIRISEDTSRLVQFSPYGNRWTEKLPKLLSSIMSDEEE